ncbi:MAG: hypothetical protein IKJ24_01720 [Clostridia bacterium]|nr:hypothetical protein [Clostridia bacterium]
MKRTKKQIKEELLEGLLEIVLSLAFCAIGALIISLIGIDLDASSIDLDLLILIGIVAFLAVFGITFAVIHLIKKKKKDL